MAMQAQLYRVTVPLKFILNDALVFPLGDSSLLGGKLVARSLTITFSLSVWMCVANDFMKR
jgi:hypothetical protein